MYIDLILLLAELLYSILMHDSASLFNLGTISSSDGTSYAIVENNNHKYCPYTTLTV